jgi:hypothetical protein
MTKRWSTRTREVPKFTKGIEVWSADGQTKWGTHYSTVLFYLVTLLQEDKDLAAVQLNSLIVLTIPQPLLPPFLLFFQPIMTLGVCTFKISFTECTQAWKLSAPTLRM